jgi:8-oxo-dGTP diphosphatase
VTENPTWLPVVAAAIMDPQGRLLMHRRPPGKAHAGLWEFPGGKVETDEIPVQALLREITEELGIALDPKDVEPLTFAETGPDSGGMAIVILLYIARSWRGEPRSREGGGCGWFTPVQAAALAKPPLDVVLLDRLARTLPGQGLE